MKDVKNKRTFWNILCIRSSEIMKVTKMFGSMIRVVLQVKTYIK